MHLLIVWLIVWAVGIPVLAIFLDWSRVKANGLLFVLQDYVRQVSRQVTLKRIIYAIGILLFVSAAWPALGFDWAYISIGGDAMLYLEIVSTVYLVAMRGYIRQITPIVASAIARTIQKGMTSLRSRSRDRRSPRRNSSSGERSDDDAAPAMLGAMAFS